MAKYLDKAGLTRVWDKITNKLAGKVDKVAGKQLSTNDYTTAEKNKLAGIATGAEVNQNAFSNVKVGDTTVAADNKTDTFTLEAGSNITLTPDATNDKVTITAKDTTYGNATSAAAGLMSAADKAKLDGVAANANNYSLPSAGTTLGGVKTGGVATISGGQITAISQATKVVNALTVGSKTYDGAAAVSITAADLGLSSAMKFLGTSSTAITDNATISPITIGESSVTPTAGNVVLYGNKEFVWTGSKWEELGNEGSYKVVQSAVASPSASGDATAFIDTISQDTNGKITATKKNVTFPTLSGGTAATADATVTGGVTVSGHTVTVAKKTLTAGNNISISGAADKITISATDTKYSNMGGATSSAAGGAGLVPAPAAGEQNSYLRGDGTWSTPTDTTYGVATSTSNGLMSAADKTKLDGISETGGYVLPAATSSTLGGVKTGANITNTSGTISITKDNVTSALGYTPATSSSTDGAATSANKLNTNAGSATKPVYFSNGVPVQCTDVDLAITAAELEAILV